MPKFEAKSISDLFTAARCEGRTARVVAYAAEGKTFTHIVACEASDGSWCEFDGTDLDHAKALAANAVDWLSARGCTVWAFAPDNGCLVGTPVYNIFENFDA